MTWVDDALIGLGIDPPSNGSMKTRCPECSDFRMKRKEKCMRIRIDQNRGIVAYTCYHCGLDDCYVSN